MRGLLVPSEPNPAGGIGATRDTQAQGLRGGLTLAAVSGFPGQRSALSYTARRPCGGMVARARATPTARVVAGATAYLKRRWARGPDQPASPSLRPLASEGCPEPLDQFSPLPLSGQFVVRCPDPLPSRMRLGCHASDHPYAGGRSRQAASRRAVARATARPTRGVRCVVQRDHRPMVAPSLRLVTPSAFTRDTPGRARVCTGVRPPLQSASGARPVAIAWARAYHRRAPPQPTAPCSTI